MTKRDNTLTLLHAPFRELLLLVEADIAAKGLHLVRFETYRGEELQKLARKTGASKAGWLKSPHNFGMAADYVLNTKFGYVSPWQNSFEKQFKGHPLSAQADEQWRLFGIIVKSHGLRWGGDFKSPVDKPHFELANWKEAAANGK